MLVATLSCGRKIAPGLALCLSVTLAAFAGAAVEAHVLGRAFLEALVLAILIGAAVRTAWTPCVDCKVGIDFSAKFLLEVAVVLLGLSVSAATVVAAGPVLLGGIVGTVLLAITISYVIGRGLGLSHKIAVLIACGNSICGNSAIAVTAPIIDADGDDVATSIAFTAVLGVAVVLLLPLMVGLIGLTKLQYGVFAGLTVYAVPQVIAATAPVGALCVQVGTLVKLVRVLMIGPVVLILSLTNPRKEPDGNPTPRLGRLLPWFIVCFLAMAGLRAVGLAPEAILRPAAWAANFLTVVAMAGLGLCVDVRTVARAGFRVTCAVVLSLLALACISFGLIVLLALR